MLWMDILGSCTGRIYDLLREYYLVLIGIVVLLIPLAPNYILGRNALIGVHDTFDSTFVWYKILLDSGMIFADSSAIVPAMMDGLPRVSFGSEFSVLLWLFVLFKPYAAYLINITIMRLVGFVGMYFLLSNHFLPEERHKYLVLGVSLCFGFLPFYPPGGLSVASLPLALYAFLNIRAKKASKVDYALLLLIPFYSSFIYSYLFFLIMVGLLWLWTSLKTHELRLNFFASIAMMTIVFLFVEYRLIYSIFFEGFVSHRVEFLIYDNLSLHEALDNGLRDFILGQYHAHSFHTLVIAFAVAFSILLLLSSRFASLRKPIIALGLGGIGLISLALLLFGYFSPSYLIYRILSSILLGSFYPYSLVAGVGLIVLFIILFVFMMKRSEKLRLAVSENSNVLVMLASFVFISALFALWFGLWSSEFVLPWKQQFSFLRTIDLGRFHWLHPLLWYLMFAISLAVIIREVKYKIREIELGKIIAIALILLQLAILVPNSWEHLPVNQPITFNQFFAEDLFQEIEADIGMPQDTYRVISIGLHPSISQYNGFYTLDGYSNNYPLEYKHRFRNIIGYELAKSEEIRNYFDGWGSRCYIMTAELGLSFFCKKDEGLILTNLELNVTALHEMNCSYVFSAVNITNYAANSLQFNGLYQHPVSAWDIYLYEVL